ncbi:helix-turn-helix domain-containing protein [Methylomonas sp. DH-1]|uniref:helix-turn-helix domain-containing protein n=1 Tax=Methylomonas sp. (strain DH-1) TaxID=1727196 RepID=UPI0018D4B540|nr:helix-turn-helix domain-containing protein [Methylomonas sp. DH-1]
MAAVIQISEYLTQSVTGNGNINAVPPLMEPAKFAELIGVSYESVRHWVKRGHIPTIKVGGRRFINYALLFQTALNQAS